MVTVGWLASSQLYFSLGLKGKQWQDFSFSALSLNILTHLCALDCCLLFSPPPCHVLFHLWLRRGDLRSERWQGNPPPRGTEAKEKACRLRKLFSGRCICLAGWNKVYLYLCRSFSYVWHVWIEMPCGLLTFAWKPAMNKCTYASDIHV